MNTKNDLKKGMITLLTAILMASFFPQISPISFLAGHKSFGRITLSLIPEAAANTDIEILHPTAYTDKIGNTTDAEKAYDYNINDSNWLTSSADIKTGVDALPSIIFHTWQPKSKVYESLTLYIKRESRDHINDMWGIKYSTNGGASWYTLDAMTSKTVAGEVAVDLNPSQNLSDLQVRMDTDRVKTADNGHLFIYDIRTEGKIYVPPTLYQSAHRFFKNVDSVDLSGIVSNVSGAEEANAIAVDASHVYVVGFEPGKWRIEKRSLRDGYLVGSVTSDTGGGGANAIAIDGSSMYVVGDDYSGGNYKWRIEKRDLVTLNLVSGVAGFGENRDGVVISDPSTGNDVAYAIAIDRDKGFMYVVGSDRSPGSTDAQWRIEKRSLSDGALIDWVVNNPSADDDVPLAIAVDQYYMYVVGYDRIPTTPGSRKNKSSSYAEWRIEKRSLSDLSTLVGLATSNPIGHNAVARGVAVDAEAIYIIGSEELGFFDTAWRIEKRSLNSFELVTQFDQDGVILENPPNDEEAPSFDDQPYAIVISGDYMYLAGHSATGFTPGGTADTEWRIEKRRLDNGTLVPGFGSSGVVINDIYPNNNDKAYAIAIDPVDPNDPYKERSVYIAGYDNPGLSEWRIEKRSLDNGALSLLEPLSDQNTEAFIPSGQNFRLRVLVHVNSGTLLQNGQQFKLQFSPDANDWKDVTDASEISFWNNPTPYDGDPLLENAEDPFHETDKIRYQTYEETKGFTNALSTIEAGEDGIWDFSLHAAIAGTFNFRIVKDDGSANGSPLDHYLYPYPKITAY